MEIQHEGDWTSQLKSTITSIQYETIKLVILAFFLTGLGILITLSTFSDPTWSLLSATVLFLSGVFAWRVNKHNYLLAAVTLIVISQLVIGSAVIWKGIVIAIGLSVVPVGLSMLMVSRKAGLFTALLNTGFLFLLTLPVADDQALRVISVIGIWFTLGSVWLVFQPLLKMVQWVWYGNEQNQIILEQSRDYQAKLVQTKDELTSANSNLARLNQLAMSLRKVAEDERNIKTQFVANVSHELRTPLNMIIGFCEMIMQSPDTYDYNLPPALLADLAVVLRNSQHLSGLIDDVLDLSQIEAGQMALTKEWVNIEEIIRSAVVAVQPLYQSKNLNLNTRIKPEVPPVYCDRTRIREVMLNLLSNAGRFTEQGEVTIGNWIEDDNLVISIQDTGKGIDQELQKKLFQPFQQFENKTYRHYGGSGLGLSISKHFVEMHDGEMWATSEPGVGSTFFFRLPILSTDQLDPSVSRWFNPYQTYDEHPAPPKPIRLHDRPKIAVVESGEFLQRMLNRYVGNYDIVSYPSLEQAFDATVNEPVQTMVINRTDVGEAIAEINQNNQIPYSIPVIICSIPGAETAALALGVTEYLLKPISREKILKIIEKASPGARSILIVDDDADVRRLFARMLTSGENAYRVIRASTGREALNILKDEKPDVILLDLVMPEMDGYQFMMLKSQDPSLKDIPVILITARDPIDQPVITKTLSVTSQAGLSIRETLDCIRALTAILSKTGPTAGLMLTTDPVG